jgi:WD40 repeat protein
MIHPYPGLRPFGADEAHLFFGREEHVDELLEKLRQNRFVAVVGTSGSGKSSLVFAGLFPALDGGALGTEWRIASMRPGRDPFGNLARALRDPAVRGGAGFESGLETGTVDPELEAAFAEAALRRSTLGLIEAARELALRPGESLLVLVDQFEEIFRYRGQDTGRAGDTDAFVPLLLEAARQTEVPVHVILTMRSDFLGQCVRFPGLAEAINSGQYLIPRLNRRQRLAAIAGPARVAGAEISPPLLQRLLNDVGDNPDQLPIHQHALLAGGTPDEPIGIDAYESAGTLERALSNHAEEVFAELTDRQREIAAALFRSLTETTPEGQHIRRPAALGEVAEIAGASLAEVLEVVEPFRAPGRTFLVLPPGPVTPETRVDISHESLMRLWDRLRDWADEEARAAQTYRRMAEDARLHAAGEVGLWRDPELELALRWRERRRPNAAWARRYGLPFEPVQEFLERSRAERDREAVEKEQARERELAQMRALAEAEQSRAVAERERAETERRNARRLRRAMAVVVVALLAALVSMSLAMIETRKVRESQVLELAASANHLSEGHSHFDGLLKAYEAGGRLRQLQWRPIHNPEIQRAVETALVHALSGITARNSWTAHRDWPTSLAALPGGSWLSAGHDRVIRSWSPAGRLQAEIKDHQAPVLSLAASPAASPADPRFVSGDARGRLIFWRLEGARGVRVAERQAHGGQAVRHLAFQPDGRLVASSGADGALQLWRPDGTPVPAAPVPGCEVRAVRFHPRRPLLAVGCGDGQVHLFESRPASPGGEESGWTERLRLRPVEGPAGPVLSLAFDPQGGRVAAGDQRGRIHVWPLAGGPAAVLQHDGPVHAILFSARDQALLAAGADRMIHVWRYGGREQVLRGHNEPVVALALSADGHTLASTSRDHTVRTWQLKNPYQAILTSRQGTVWEVDVHPGGGLIASAGEDGSVRLWTADGAAVRQSLAGFPELVRSVRFSPDGRWLAAGSHGGQVRVWEVGKAGPGLRLRERAAFTADPEGVGRVAFSREGNLLLTTGLGGTVRAWHPDTGQPAQAAGPAAKLWFDEDRAVIGQLRLEEILPGPGQRVNDTALSPDRSRLAAAVEDGEVQLWDLATRTRRRSLLGHDGSATSVVFSPRGDFLISAGADETVRIWRQLDLSFDELMDRAADWLRDYRALQAGPPPAD